MVDALLLILFSIAMGIIVFYVVAKGQGWI